MIDYKNKLLKLLEKDRVQIDTLNYNKFVKNNLRKNCPIDDICGMIVDNIDENIEYLQLLRNRIEKIGNDYSWDIAMED